MTDRKNRFKLGQLICVEGRSGDQYLLGYVNNKSTRSSYIEASLDPCIRIRRSIEFVGLNFMQLGPAPTRPFFHTDRIGELYVGSEEIADALEKNGEEWRDFAKQVRSLKDTIN